LNVARKLRDNLEEIAQLEMLQIGKPISDARDEAGLGARVFEYYAGAISYFGGQTLPVARGGFDFTLRQPMGVVAAIVPWNFPFPIGCWKAAPALAAGNCVVLAGVAAAHGARWVNWPTPPVCHRECCRWVHPGARLERP
jgi:acyl-CoA reductase-like NAD-dependent aldehyde dehydrogenase